MTEVEKRLTLFIVLLMSVVSAVLYFDSPHETVGDKVLILQKELKFCTNGVEYTIILSDNSSTVKARCTK